MQSVLESPGTQGQPPAVCLGNNLIRPLATNLLLADMQYKTKKCFKVLFEHGSDIAQLKI